MFTDVHIFIYDKGIDLGATVCWTMSGTSRGISPGPLLSWSWLTLKVYIEVFSLTLIPPVPILTLRDRLDMHQPAVVHHWQLPLMAPSRDMPIPTHRRLFRHLASSMITIKDSLTPCWLARKGGRQYPIGIDHPTSWLLAFPTTDK